MRVFILISLFFAGFSALAKDFDPRAFGTWDLPLYCAEGTDRSMQMRFYMKDDEYILRQIDDDHLEITQSFSPDVPMVVARVSEQKIP